ncbi:MAG: PASTA domain-containing protein [Bacteroidota bacterium]
MKPTRRLLKVLLLHLSLMVAVFSSIAFLFFEVVLPIMIRHGQSITVPDVKGAPLDALDELLTQRNLCFKIIEDAIYSPAYPPSVVLEQYPKPGARVKEGRSISITLNAKPPEVSMPNLIDGSVRNAQVLLKSRGLTHGTIQYVPDIAKNAVLAQQYKGQPIASGTRIAQGSQIDLVVGAGLGKQLIAVPDVVGMTLEAAELLFLDVGVGLGSVVYKRVDSLGAGTICRQVPSVGAQVRIGETVDLWLVEGKQEEPAIEPDTPILQEH